MRELSIKEKQYFSIIRNIQLSCMYIQTNDVCTYKQTIKHTKIHMLMCTYICTYIRTYIHTYVHMCMYACIHTYVCTYVHMYVCTCIQTTNCLSVRLSVCLSMYISVMRPSFSLFSFENVPLVCMARNSPGIENAPNVLLKRTSSPLFCSWKREGSTKQL